MADHPGKEQPIGRRQLLASAGIGLAAATVAAGSPADAVGATNHAADASEPSPQSGRRKMMSLTPHARPKGGFHDFTVENTAVALIDHQTGVIDWAGELTPPERVQLKMWVSLLARFAKATGMPIALTTSLETEQQGPTIPELQRLLPDEYARRVKRVGIVNAWDDPNYADSVRSLGRKNLIMAGLTTDICLTPPALSAAAEGYNVVAALDASGAGSRTAASTSERLLEKGGVEMMAVLPLLCVMAKDYKTDVGKKLHQAMSDSGVWDVFKNGDVR